MSGGDVLRFPDTGTDSDTGSDPDPDRDSDPRATAATDGAAPQLPPTEIRVRFHELDPYGHVNHGVYPNYFEAARIDVLDHLSIGIETLRQRGLHLVVVEARLRFRAPAVARDVLQVRTRLTELRPASSWWHQELHRPEDGRLIAECDVRTATADPDGRPRAVPADLLTIVRPYVTTG